MTTVGQVLEQIRLELTGGMRHEVNRLDGAILAAATSLSVEFDAGGITAGALLAIEDELVHVWSVSAKTATVQRGMFGTTAANHADAAMVEVSPVASRGVIRNTMKEEIRSWPASLYGAVSETASLTSTARTHLATLTTAGIRRVLDVREYRTDYGVTDYQTWPRLRHYETVRGLTAAGSTDLQLLGAGRGTQVWVLVATDFVLDDFEDDDDLEDDVGLSSSMLDILRWGTLMRLVPQRELARARTDVQGEPRDAAEVPPQANAQVAVIYKTLRDQRIAEEANRLREFYPEGS